MKRFLMPVLCVAMAGVCFAQGQNLEMLTQSSSGNVTYLLRTDRVTRGAYPGQYTVWVFAYARRPEYLEKNGGGKIAYSSFASQYALYCKGGTYGVGQSTYYDADGKVVAGFLGNIGYTSQPVPDTVGDGILHNACQFLGTPVS